MHDSMMQGKTNLNFGISMIDQGARYSISMIDHACGGYILNKAQACCMHTWSMSYCCTSQIATTNYARFSPAPNICTNNLSMSCTLTVNLLLKMFILDQRQVVSALSGNCSSELASSLPAGIHQEAIDGDRKETSLCICWLPILFSWCVSSVSDSEQCHLHGLHPVSCQKHNGASEDTEENRHRRLFLWCGSYWGRV